MCCFRFLPRVALRFLSRVALRFLSRVALRFLSRVALRFLSSASSTLLRVLFLRDAEDSPRSATLRAGDCLFDSYRRVGPTCG